MSTASGMIDWIAPYTLFYLEHIWKKSAQPIFVGNCWLDASGSNMSAAKIAKTRKAKEIKNHITPHIWEDPQNNFANLLASLSFT